MTSALNEQQAHQLEADLKALRDDIVAVLDTAKERGKTVELDQQLAGRVSRMDAIQQQQMAQANSRQYAVRLVQINAALKRIEDEEFGVCLSCDENIAFARLKVRPESPLCIICQEQSEH